MKTVSDILRFLDENYADVFSGMYPGESYLRQKARYTGLLERHSEEFGDLPSIVVSAPGRTELGGNHTDHNLGMVLAASVTMDTLAVVSPAEDGRIIFCSEGWEPVSVEAEPKPPVEDERGTTAALIRGVSARLSQLGFSTGGFRCSVVSDVLRGSGLSSSASVEVLLGTIISELYNGGGIGRVVVAGAGQWAENNYFGKACGLMDQIACANGGIVEIDFRDPGNPGIVPVDFSFREHGYALVMISTGAGHDDLSAEYDTIPAEMKAAAALLGGRFCRDISLRELLGSAPEIRAELGDRAFLRAYHFLTENARVASQIEALRSGGLAEYLGMVSASGDSSFKYLQNIYVGSRPESQGLSVALAVTENFLAGDGACRVQGGGFAGTIQAYVPLPRLDEYCVLMESVFGAGAVSELVVRPRPACRVV